MAQKALPDGYHFAISISQNLWSDLLGEALPIQVGQGDFDLVDQGRKLLAAAESQVKGLLTGVEEKLDEAPVLGNPMVRNARGRIASLARKGRDVASRRFQDAVSIRGKWRAKVARDGSHFSYHDGGVTLDARAVFEADGRVLLFGDSFDRALGASDSLLAALARGERPLLFEDEWRTPLDVTDAADALLELAANSFRGVLHVAGPERLDRVRLAVLVLRARGFNEIEARAKIRQGTRASLGMDSTRPADVALDTTLARKLLAVKLRGVTEALTPH